MNYRHAFRAGNFADCMKHALVDWLIDAAVVHCSGRFRTTAQNEPA
jgi:23S rRNA A2030 N6-methylase RlmJ